MAFKDLSHFMDYLEEEGELVRVPKEVNVRHEIAAYIRKMSDSQGPALLFERVKGFDIPVVGGIFATRRRLCLAMQCEEGAATRKFVEGMRNPIAPKLVSDGPCQEVIHRGEEVDLTKLPVPIYSGKDSGPFLTLGVVVSKDPDTGRKNMGLYRMEVKGKNRLGISAQQLFEQLAHAEARNEGLPVAIALGSDPALCVAATWNAPFGVDEMEMAGGLRGSPVELVKATTVDLEVPAEAEIVIEGRVLPHVRETEGPFGEFPGYYSSPTLKPVIEVTAITRRRNPVFLAGLTGMPTTENHILKQIALEASCYWDLSQKFRCVRAVHFPAAGAQNFMAVVSVEKPQEYEARNIIATLLGNRANIKLVIVVDNDVDIQNVEKVMWAVTTRSQPDEDVIVLPQLCGSGLDPSALKFGISSRMGIDATMPFGRTFAETVDIPGLDQVPDLDEIVASSRKAPSAHV